MTALRIENRRPRKWLGYIWDTLDKAPQERHFLLKLDVFLFGFACLGYFLKSLDQYNINNAFVSGMKEDLSLYGNELNYFVTSWTIGYILGQIPGNIALTRIRPSVLLPVMEIVWSSLTMLLARCKTTREIVVLRFFVGLAESIFWPGIQYVLGSWYRRDELAKRSSILYISGQIAVLFSGYLMTGAFHLNDKGSLWGWQWLFIFDGIISLPIAVAGFFCYPDLPRNSKAWFLSKDERILAVQRMDSEGRSGKQPWTAKKVKGIVSSWRIYGLCVLYTFLNNANAGAPVFAQYLKTKDYPVWKINVYPTGSTAVQIVVILLLAWGSDSLLKGCRWPSILTGALANIVPYVSLAVWNIPEGWRWACYYFIGTSAALAGVCFAWAQEICGHDDEERAIVIASMNTTAFIVQAWLPLIVWQQVDEPQYRKGFVTVACLSVLLTGQTLIVRFLHKRQNLRHSVQLGDA